MKAWGLTDVGVVREINQDTFRMEYDNQTGRGLFLVCDGMGGAAAGEVASGLAADAFLQNMDNCWKERFDGVDFKARLLEAYTQANEVVYDASRANPDYAGMGTTMVAAICGDGQALVGNVGDSRAYFLDENGMRQITEDHSLVTELMKRGDLTPYQASRHPSRNVITRAIGADATVQCDTFAEQIKPGNFLLLCIHSGDLAGESLVLFLDCVELLFQVFFLLLDTAFLLLHFGTALLHLALML